MKPMPCDICGRYILVGNATKFVVCAVCRAKWKRDNQTTTEEGRIPPRYCANPNCKKAFVPRTRWQKYCSHECKIAMYRKEPQIIQCRNCGKDFEGDKRSRYCSDRCREEAKRRRGNNGY